MSTKKRARGELSPQLVQLRVRPQLSSPNPFFANVPHALASAAILLAVATWSTTTPAPRASLPTQDALNTMREVAACVTPRVRASLVAGQGEEGATTSLEALSLRWAAWAQRDGAVVRDTLKPRAKIPSTTLKRRVQDALNTLQDEVHGAHVRELPPPILDVLVYTSGAHTMHALSHFLSLSSLSSLSYSFLSLSLSTFNSLSLSLFISNPPS